MPIQVMAGETPEGALVRELEEELGIQVSELLACLALNQVLKRYQGLEYILTRCKRRVARL